MGMKKKLKISSLIYYFAIIFWLFHRVLPYTFFDESFSDKFMEKICYAAFFFLIVKLVFFDFYFVKKNIIYIIFLLGNIYFAVVACGEKWYNSILFVTLLIIASHDQELENICRFISIFMMLFLIAIIVTYYLGISDTVIYEFRERNTIGFRHYSNAPFVYLACVFPGVYAFYNKFKKISVWFILSIMTLNIYIYIMTDTRWPFIIITLYLISWVVFCNNNIFNNFQKRKLLIMLFLVTLFIIACFFYISYNYDADSVVYRFIDLKLFNTRISLNKQAFELYKLKPFGQKIIYSSYEDPRGYFYLDSGYMSVLFNYGWVVLALFFTMYLMIFIDALKNNNFLLAIWIILLLIFNVMNEMIFNFERATCILLISNVIKKWSLNYKYYHIDNTYEKIFL